MQKNIQYVMDQKGNKIAVQVPLDDWNKLLKDYKKLKQYHRLKRDLSEAFDEIKKIENGEIEPETLEDFLNEC
jgi:hypothetical protein